MNWPEIVRQCFETDSILYTRHARTEMQHERFGQITDQEVFEAAGACEMIVEYPDDRPYPSVLLFGKTAQGRPIHMVCAYAMDVNKVIVVTVYQPDSNRWEDFRRRKS